jgi:hypothetical protein
MGDLREGADIETSFSAATRLLDDALLFASPRLAHRGIEIIDRSNRSGFDRSGYPNYFWEHEFRNRSALEKCVLLAVRVAWVEPTMLSELPGQVNVRVRVEVFYPGQAPPLFASEPYNRDVPLDACAGSGLLEMIEAGLLEAAGSLPAEYRDRVALQ